MLHNQQVLSGLVVSKFGIRSQAVTSVLVPVRQAPMLRTCPNMTLGVGTIFQNLFGVLRHFQHYTGHIMTGSWEGRGNQYIQLVKVMYCKLQTNSKQLPA